MLTPEETEHIRRHAYLPEHIIPYVTSISGAEPFLTGGFLCYLVRKTLIFVGYPLQGDFSEQEFHDALETARRIWRPDTLSVIAPTSSRPLETCTRVSSDHYYGCSLPIEKVNAKLKNLLKRASRDVTVAQDRELTEPHLNLIRDFLLARQIDDATRVIYHKIPDYVAASDTAMLFSARRPDGTLSAFSIGEYWGAQTAMYMFNVTSRKNHVPGVSDFLLSELLREAGSRGHARANLGLGISKGVTFFKEKWGAKKMYDYHHYTCEAREGEGFAAFFRRLLSQ